MDIVWDDDNFIEVVLLAMQEDDDSTEEDEGQVEHDEEQQAPPPHQWGIVTRVVAHDDYLRQKKKDASGKLGLSSLQKTCLALRQLTSGVSSSKLRVWIST